MSRQIFTQTVTDVFSLRYDASLNDDLSFADNLTEVLYQFRQLKENAKPVFARVEPVSDGYIELELREEQPLRIIQMWSNRIEKTLQDLCHAQKVA